MDWIRLVFFVVYRYYSTAGKNRDVAYFQTLLIFVAAIYINFLCLVRLFHFNVLSGSLFDIGNNKGSIEMLEILLLVLLPGYFFLSRIIKEGELKGLTYSETMVLKGKRILFSYFVFSLVLIVLTILLSRNN